MPEPILTLRELNRATLARQFLLERTNRRTLDVIQHLIAMQGQVSNAPYLGLWTRMRAFSRAELTVLFAQREVVRASSLRRTLHVLTAEDYLVVHPLLQRSLSRQLHLFARRTDGFEMERLIGEMLAYIREQPRTSAEIRGKLEEFAPGMGQLQIVDALRIYLALIQIPPAGTWGFTGRPLHAEATVWLGRPLADHATGSAALRQVVCRYLGAFGPASVEDLQVWSGLRGLRPTVDALRPVLCRYRDEQGRELFDLPDAPRPPAETPAPVRLLAAFENVILGFADRQRILPDRYRSVAFSGDRMLRTILVDGFVCGLWKVERRPTSSVLTIDLFEPLSNAHRCDVQEEGEHLMRWILDAPGPFDIHFSQR